MAVGDKSGNMAVDNYALEVLKQAGLNDTSVLSNALPFPLEEDARALFKSKYEQKAFLNCVRPLDYTTAMKAVIRNTGETPAGHIDYVPCLPNPANLFRLVWRRVPNILKDRINAWAREKQRQPIAREIASYVKEVLLQLPIPVPRFLIHASVNLAVPPLVEFIIGRLGSLDNLDITESFSMNNAAAPQPDWMKELDREILLSAGLPASELPTHLKTGVGEERTAPSWVAASAPDDRDATVDLKQFYQTDFRNGCRPMPLVQFVTAQIRTNPGSDEGASKFAPRVWKTLTREQQDKLKTLAEAAPPKKGEIAQLLYGPVVAVLGKPSNLVPLPIRPTFASFKVPEVTEWVVAEHGTS